MPRNLVSIIVCTRDRAEDLRETLQALDETLIPDGRAAEALVVDNDSRDRTRAVVRQAKVWGKAARYVFEPRQGLSFARNTAAATAQGEVLLWTDDDVRPGRAWLEAMCRPILDGKADAVGGRIVLPACLERPWLRPWHRVCLAVDSLPADDFNLVGGNMAFARRVLDTVPRFDPELGPGGLGFCDDTLFSLQLRAAGLRLLAAGEDSTALHHCGEQRLTRAALMDMLVRQGRSRAYVDYHWRHLGIWFPTFRGGKSLLGLGGLRILQRVQGTRQAIIGRHEARWLWRWSYYRQIAIESQRPRQYERFGLEKLTTRACRWMSPMFASDRSSSASARCS